MSDFHELTRSIFQCSMQLQRVGLKWNSDRVKRWLKAKEIKSYHFMNQEDFDSLSRAIAKIETSEYIIAKTKLTVIMTKTRITYKDPTIQAWLKKVNAINEGLTVEQMNCLTTAIEKSYQEL